MDAGITDTSPSIYNETEDVYTTNPNSIDLNNSDPNNYEMEDYQYQEDISEEEEMDDGVPDNTFEEDDDDDDEDEGSTQSIEEANTEYQNTLNSISGPSESLRLYSGFDEIVGNSGNSDKSNSDTFEEKDSFDAHDVSSHLKGALAFGLASKGNSSRNNADSELSVQQFYPNKGIMVFRPNNKFKKTDKLRIERKKDLDKIDHLTEDLKIGYRILTELMTDSLKTYNSVFMEPIDLSRDVNGDYLDVINDPIWLPKIKEKLLKEDYKSITDLILDIRNMLQNAYKYFGSSHSFSRKGLRLEFILEQKLNLLPKDIRAKCTLEETHSISTDEIKEMNRTKSSRITVQGDNYFSYLLFTVRTFRPAREKEVKMKRVEGIRLAKMNKEKQYEDWDDSLFSGSLGGPIENMWEIPQINQFIFLSVKALNICELSIYELERILMIPESSMTLRILMTSLVSSPVQRLRITEKPFMPYNVWARKLAGKVYMWYKAYQKEKRNAIKVFESLGIDPTFWEVCGKRNPLERQLFNELTVYQRIWLVKTLCDYISHNHKSIQEAIADVPEENLRETIIGKDRDGYTYLYFTRTVIANGDLRIYRSAKITYHENSTLETVNDSMTLYTPQQIQQFRKIMKIIKREQGRDDDWMWSRKPAKKKKKKKKSSANTPVQEIRIRPERLRQTPKARYNEVPLSDDETSEEDYTINHSSRRKDIEELMNPLFHSPHATINPKRKDEQELISKSMCKKQKTTEDEISRAAEEPEAVIEEDKLISEQKDTPIPKKKKSKKRKNCCPTCGKSFATRSAMNGHSAIHTKKKVKIELKEEASESKDDIKNNEDLNGAENVEKKFDSKIGFLKKEEIKEENDDSTNCDSSNLINSTVKDEDCAKINMQENESRSDLTKTLDENLVTTEPNFISEKELRLPRAVSPKSSKGQDSTVSDGKMDKTESINDLNAQDDEKQIMEEKRCNSLETNSDLISTNSIHEPVVNGSEGEVETTKDTTEPEIKSLETNSSTPSECEEDYSPTILSPNSHEFQLVVSSIVELRDLICKFGVIPEKLPKPAETVDEEQAQSDSEEEMNCDVKDGERPLCEIKLHKVLCKMLAELIPLETRMKTLKRQMRKKLWTEYHDWKKRDSSYVDEAEEAWKSDPEPDPVPSATQTPKQSSSSSSSDDEIYDDGTRKRKLRKRRVKKVIRDVSPSSSINGLNVDSPIDDTITVSSRGRIRKVKKIYNYDQMDFEKLAKQAKQDAQDEKDRKRKLREEEIKSSEATAVSSSTVATTTTNSSSEIRKYILSKNGDVVGYIGKDGKLQVQRNNAQNPISPTQVAGANTVMEPHPNSPKLAVSAKNDEGKPVCISLFGEQALKLMEHIKKFRNDEPKLIKITRCSKTYTFMTDSKISMSNIPGFANTDSFTSPSKIWPKEFPPIVSSPVPVVSSVAKPSSLFTYAAKTNSSNDNKVTTVSSTNPVALAYQGIQATASLKQPYSIVSPMAQATSSMVTNTKLVTANSSTVPSVCPLNAVANSCNAVTVVPSQTMIQTDQGQTIRIGIGSEKLSQLIQKPGQRIVAIPNGKGGYAITLVSANKGSGPQTVNSAISPSKLVAAQHSLINSQPSSTVFVNQSQTVMSPSLSSPTNHLMVQSSMATTRIVNAPSTSTPMTRQVIIQNTGSGTPTILQQSPQIVQIQQQSPQKLIQVAHAGSGRQLVQLIQGGQIIVAGNNVTVQQQPTGAIMMSSPKVQPQFLYSQPVQQEPAKLIQVASSQDQFIQQQVVLQPRSQQQQPQQQQQHIIIQQQPTETLVSVKENQSEATFIQQALNQCDQEIAMEGQTYGESNSSCQIRLASPIQIQQKQVNQSAQLIQRAVPQLQQQQQQQVSRQPQIVAVQQQIPQQQSQSVTLQQVPQVSATQQITLQSNSPTLVQRPQQVVIHQQVNNTKVQQQPTTTRAAQPCRLVMLQTNEGQKICSLSPEGTLSILSSEQLQPLIANGTIKIS